MDVPTRPDLAPELVINGFFKRWLVKDGNGHACTVPPSASNTPEAREQARDDTRRRDVYVRVCKDTEVDLTLQVKALKMEACERCVVDARGGAVASVELLRCKRIVLRLHGPVAAVRVDDCNDITVECSWTARLGFLQDTAEGAAAPTGAGLNVFSTGSHAVRINAPISAEADAPRMERLLPETLHTTFGAGSQEPTTTIVDARTPWGATKPAERHAPRTSAAGAASTDPAPTHAGAAVEGQDEAPQL